MQSKIEVHCCSRFSFDELQGWQPEQISAFFLGMAQVLAADKENRRVATDKAKDEAGLPTE